MADLHRTVYPHSSHPSSEGRAQDRVSSPARDRRSANCAMQPVGVVAVVVMVVVVVVVVIVVVVVVVVVRTVILMHK